MDEILVVLHAAIDGAFKVPTEKALFARG